MAFCCLLENLVINMEKLLMDTSTEIGIDAAKTVSKRVVQKTAEATGDLIGKKVADKITSVSKWNEKEKNKESRINLHSTRKERTKYWWS